jgi:hypothetical protein
MTKPGSPGVPLDNAPYLLPKIIELNDMDITHDEAKGWVEGGSKPRWRSSSAAFKRLHQTNVYWHNGAHGVVTAHLETGTTVLVIRRYLAHKRWSVNIEGFEFWQFVRLLDKETWTTPMGFDNAKDARAFATRMLEQVGAKILKAKPVTTAI